MRLLLIRHGATKGNLEKRYVGTTDEGLAPKGREALKTQKKQYEHFPVSKVYISHLKRTKETAEILFPKVEKIECSSLGECNFGKFEYKNYMELDGDKDYQRFIDSNGWAPFPEGESREAFSRRCCKAFETILQREIEQEKKSLDAKDEVIAFVVHGGTIMAVLEKFGPAGNDYYDWQVRLGEGYSMEVVPELAEGNDGQPFQLIRIQKIESIY